MILEFDPSEVAPEGALVLARLGIPAGAVVPPRIEGLCGAAAEIFAQHVAPAGILEDLSNTTFAEVYRGEGRNAEPSPVAEISSRAEHLALFAVTLGESVSQAVGQCFADQDFALGYTLDAMASVAADALGEQAERRFEARLRVRGWTAPDGAALRYSPGYCGWDVTGQRALFAYLRPEAIGLSLTPSCLMRPLKSVSGVLIAGPRAIHRFAPTYDFCERCEERTCRDRLRALAALARR